MIKIFLNGYRQLQQRMVARRDYVIDNQDVEDRRPFVQKRGRRVPVRGRDRSHPLPPIHPTKVQPRLLPNTNFQDTFEEQLDDEEEVEDFQGPALLNSTFVKKKASSGYAKDRGDSGHVNVECVDDVSPVVNFVPKPPAVERTSSVNRPANLHRKIRMKQQQHF